MCLLSASVSLFPPYPAAVVVVLVADFISKIEIVLQMSRPMRYLLPCLRYICSRVGCRKINGAKMIQLREPRRQKKNGNATKINEKLETGGNSGDKFLKRDLKWHENNF